MKKVFLNVYTTVNLGDDLFIYIITHRYKNKFVAVSQFDYSQFASNLKIIKRNLISKMINKIIRLVTNEKKDLNSFIKMSADIHVNLGGSIFMEGTEGNPSLEYWKKVKYKEYIFSKRKAYVVGSNVGPFLNKEFPKFLAKEILSQCEDVCFRDEYSKKLFNLPNIRVAPDPVFMLDTSEYITKNAEKIVISVMDLETRPELKKYSKEYEESMKKLASQYISKGKKIIYMSFCKAEGDEEAVKRILKLHSSKELSFISVYNYAGNVKEAMTELASSELIVATRYHAMILAMILKKKFIPIIYSSKMTNVLNDMNYNGIKFEIEKLPTWDFSLIRSNHEYNLDLEKYVYMAEKQFYALDKVLNRK